MAKTLISTATASSSSSLSFTSGIDSTYGVYEFQFINMHPSTFSATWTFQVNAAGQTGFNETMTTTFFEAYNFESAGMSGLTYVNSYDQAQGTGYQKLSDVLQTDADSSISGVLTLFSPSDTTYAKHFTCVINGMASSPFAMNLFIAGYINTTAAIDEIDFKFSSGNVDAGTIKMFGVS